MAETVEADMIGNDPVPAHKCRVCGNRHDPERCPFIGESSGTKRRPR